MEDWAYRKAEDIVHEKIEYSHDNEWMVESIAAALRDAAKQEREAIAAEIEDDLDRSRTDWEVLARSLRARQP